MYLVVYEVMQLEVVHISHRRAVFKRLARSSVVKLYLAVNLTVLIYKSALLEQSLYILLVRAVENGGCDLPVKHMGDKSEVNFENLTYIHTRGNAEGVEHDLKRRAVRHERHILFGKHSGHDALVAVASCHLVAHGNLSLLRDVHAYEFIDSGLHNSLRRYCKRIVAIRPITDLLAIEFNLGVAHRSVKKYRDITVGGIRYLKRRLVHSLTYKW